MIYLKNCWIGVKQQSLTHLLTHKDVAGLNMFCERSCLYLYKHRTTEKRQIQNKRKRNQKPESIEHSYMCVWEKDILIAFSAWLLYYVLYMSMFILSLVRVMGEGWDLTKPVQPRHTYV
jgi:hypothetical protein